ncbi:MAG: SpoIIE family protein phosphatase [Clostridiales bacterium]|nr:SpoIIE family protein phosphatase [Clostridiales bacterium]
MRYRMERIGIHIAAFFVARCQLFMMYPFVVPFFMAAYLQERSGISLFIVLMLGLLSKAGYVQMIRYGSIIVCLLIMLGKTDRKKIFENNIQIAMAVGMILFSISMPFQYLVTKKDGSVIYAFLEGIIAACMVLVFEQGVAAFRAGTSRMFATNERFIGVFAMLAAALFGCPVIEKPFHLLFALCSFLLLSFAYRFESSVGITAGSVTGLLLSFQTGQVGYLAVMILLACMITLLKELGKPGVLLAYISGVVLLGILYEKSLCQPAFLIAALLAAGAFVLTPKCRKRRITGKMEQRNIESSDVLAQTVVGNRVRNFGQAFLAMEKMLALHEEEREQVNLGGLSNIYLSGDGISLLNVVESESSRLQEIRKNFIRQLGQIGEAITSFQSELNDEIFPVEYFESRVMERAAGMGICVTKAMPVKGQNERLQVYVSCYAVGNNVVTGRQLAEKISRIAGKKLVCVGKGEDVVGKQEGVFSFVEEGRFMLTTGIMRRERKGEELCGDNFSVTKLDTQKAVLMLSDGMGSGEAAFIKSEQIVDLLEQLLTAGFCRELAIELLNSFISFMTDGNLSTTLDLTMIDFYTGTADFIKLGASTTFIKRGHRVECIRSTSLPVGVLEQVEFDTCKRLLYHGDIVVMVSDGVLDGILFENKEEYLADLIAGMETSNVQSIAEQIMEDVESMQRGGLKDDSTILAVGIWERK